MFHFICAQKCKQMIKNFCLIENVLADDKIIAQKICN